MIMKARRLILCRELLWAATLSAGFGMIWLVLALLCGGFALEAWNGPEREWPPTEELVIKADGTPLIKSWPRGNPQVAAYRDLTGGPQAHPQASETADAVYLAGGPWTQSSWLSELGWESRLNAFVEPEQPGTIWYFVHDGMRDGGGYFAGYDRSSNRLVGYIAESGFRADPPGPKEQIPIQSTRMRIIPSWGPSQCLIWQGRVAVKEPPNSRIAPSRVYVPSGNRLRLVDLRTRTVRTAFEAKEPIVSFEFPARGSSSSEPPSRKPAIVIRTASNIFVLNSDHDIIRTFTIPGDSQNAHTVYWYELRDGQALAEFRSGRRTDGMENIEPLTLYRIAADGSTQGQTELTLRSGMLIWSRQRESTLVTYAFPSPLILPVEQTLMGLIIDGSGSLSAALGTMLGTFWPSLLAVNVLALVLAIAAWRRARAFALPGAHQVAWVVFVFLLGVPGYVGYRLHRRWPPRAACLSCHARVPHDRVVCAACKSPFPAPELKGIEIFA